MIQFVKGALGDKTTNFGISCKLLTKNIMYLQEKTFVFFQGATFLRDITEPLRKVKIRINNL